MYHVCSICSPEDAARSKAKLEAEPFFIGGRRVVVISIEPVPADPDGRVRVDVGLAAAPRVALTHVVARTERGML